MLSHLLHRAGIESVVVENRTRQYVQDRVRAGVLEQGTVDLMKETGVADRLGREGLVHRGIELRFARRSHRIDLTALTGGKTIAIYGQNKVVEDLTEARLAAGGQIFFAAEDVSVHGLNTAMPSIRFRAEDNAVDLQCDFIAGCDGFHGVCRSSVPVGVLAEFDRVYPFAWLGILAEVEPSSQELIYSHHERGFALHSMRSPELTRLYLQVARDEKIDHWPDERIWEELQTRFETIDGFKLKRGPIMQKGITPMHSFVIEPMQYGRLMLAGDAAHIVPPTGAKGLNLAIADVRVLARSFSGFYTTDSRAALEAYSQTCLRRVWKVQRFSWWMTSMLHRFEDSNAFDQRRQLAELEYLVSSTAASQSLAENYVGLPMDLD
jgi:p-hydroxybenzoate 3-monooxygenase